MNIYRYTITATGTKADRDRCFAELWEYTDQQIGTADDLVNDTETWDFAVVGGDEDLYEGDPLREVIDQLAEEHRLRMDVVVCDVTDGDVVGEVLRPRSQRERDDRLGERVLEFLETRRRGPHDRRSHLGHQRRRPRDIEAPAVVVNRCRRHARFDQLDAAAVYDLVIGRHRHRHRPAKVIGDAHAHGFKLWASWRGALGDQGRQPTRP